MRCTTPVDDSKEDFMKPKNNRKGEIERLALLALLTAMVAVLAYLGGFIPFFGFATLNLTLVPVVLGAAMCGPLAGAWLGGVSGAMFFVTPAAVGWMNISIAGTIVTVMVKGILSGYLAGLAYKLLEKKKRDLAVFTSAIVCPVVNTATFFLGCFVFFFDTMSAEATGKGMSFLWLLISNYAGWNFVVELVANIVLSPTILRLLQIFSRSDAQKNC